MIDRYRRAARGASELGLGWFAPLDMAAPELAGPTLDAIVAGLRALSSPRPPPRKVGHGVGQSGGSTGIRTQDLRIKDPQL